MKQLSLIAAFLVTLFIAGLSTSLAANGEQTSFNMKDFALIPVVQDGRMMPMDSFARIQQKTITDGYDNSAPLYFLADFLFMPGQAAEKPVMRVQNSGVRLLLSLPERKPPVYSLLELIPELSVHKDTILRLTFEKNTLEDVNLTAEQDYLVTLQTRAATANNLSQSLSMILPLSVTVPEMLGGTAMPDSNDWMALQKLEESGTTKLQRIMERKGQDLDRYTEQEQELATFVWQLGMVRQSAQNNNTLKIIPVRFADSATEWLSPWALLNEGKGSPATAPYLELWRDMALAYMDGDANGFAQAAAKARQMAIELGDLSKTDLWRLQAEYYYNRIDPLFLALIAFCGGLIACLPLLTGRKENLFLPLSVALLATGSVFHLLAIVLRSFIQLRPPVGTLYESVLFVVLVCALFTLLIWHKNRNTLVLICGTLLSAGLMITALYFTPQGDTMPVLVAVLNTNFWLATHVLCITIGYGFCLLTGTAAHFWLAARAGHARLFNETNLFQLIHKLCLTALLFTTIGTILGGIWADQSWGRFWGWDPKENGALLIVLWLVWALHGRLAGKISVVSYMAILAATNIIIALAWFGVNLLNTGLHSYGFISGVATGLSLFCTVEMVLIGLLWHAARNSTAPKKTNA